MEKAYFRAMILLLLVLAASAAAQTFYFLPPYDPEWMRRTPHVLDANDNYSATPMEIDLDGCGWYKINLSGKTDHKLIVWPGKPKAGTLNNDTDTDRMGVNGVDDGPDTWTGTPLMPAPIVFSDKSSTPYFDPSVGAGGWSSSRGSTEPKRCNYNMAAIIYDTDPSSFDAFKCANTGGCNFDNDPAAGIIKNIPKPKLKPNDKGVLKMEFGTRTSGLNGWNAADFENAFKCTPSKNSMICYDMPFQRDHRGLWTFDSDFLCKNGELDLKPQRIYAYTDATNLCRNQDGPVLGFFPNRLNSSGVHPGIGENENPPLDASCTYSQCPNCANKYVADPLAPLHTQESATTENCGNEYYTPPILRGYANPECYEQARTSGSETGSVSGSGNQKRCSFGSTSCGAAYQEGDFRDGDHPPIWNFDVRGWKDYDGGYLAPTPNFRTDQWGYRYGNTVAQTESNSGDAIKKNQYFCFESHATFIYEKGQKFYFSGDDDIWVFIDSTVVIDNGGDHLATPGYVDLDSIGLGRWSTSPRRLEEGNEYNLDIFFCDRRQTSSNIRVSTNMYILQRNGLMVDKGDGKNVTAELCLMQSGSGTCASLLGGDAGSGSKKLCGDQINGLIGFYIINRRLDAGSKALLDETNGGNCTDKGNGKFTCYGGINIDMSNGTAKVEMRDMNSLTGTWYVYAYVKGDETIDPEKVATITITTGVRTAWGTIKEESSTGKTITDICKNPVTAATGELVPICFSSGEQSGNNFFAGLPEDIGGLPFSLSSTSFTSQTSRSRLRVFYDSLGQSPVDVNDRLTLPGAGTATPGVLVLWVTGDYGQDVASDTYKINVTGGKSDEEYTLTSVIPRLQWIKADFQNPFPIPPSDQKGVKWITAGDPTSGVERDGGYPAPIWVGETVKLYLRALAYNGGGWDKTCETCFYDLFLKAEALIKTGEGGVSETDGRLIGASGLKIASGKATLEISGKKQVVHNNYATLAISGINDAEKARWDSLTFQEPPVPFPDNVRIFDTNGDGIGDSLVIAYSRGYDPDTLPNMIEVQWAKDTTIAYGIGIPGQTADGPVYNKPDNAANLNYWSKQFICNGSSGSGSSCAAGRFLDATALNARRNLSTDQKKALRDTIILVRDPQNDQEPARFSKDVLTRNETGKINNWVSFAVGARPFNIALTGSIDDKIPAIVVNARYTADENTKNCGTVGNPCHDKVVITLSEPVKMVNEEEAENLRKNIFAYKLRDMDKEAPWNVLEDRFLPDPIRWQNGNKNPDSVKENDSIVTLYFYRYREGSDKSGTPMPGDSVKLASIAKFYPGFAKNMLVDTHDNMPNPNEWGRQLEGRKPFTPDKIPIGEIDPNWPYYVDKIKETLNDNGSKDYGTIFPNERPIELLPVPPDWTIRDVQREYPGTVGILFNPDVFNSVSDLEDIYCPKREPSCLINDADIVIYPRAFFHTNLGNYVSDNLFEGGIRCDNPIFPISDRTNSPSCRDSRSKFYIAWDMKDMKGRYVGAGAYVGIYDFRWEVYVKAVDKVEKMENIERQIEMHGVKRVKKR